MPTADEYEAKIKMRSWDGLWDLWEAVKRRETPGWDAGKAFEYVILRAFDLNGAQVRWPYPVSHMDQKYKIIRPKLVPDQLTVTAY